MKRTATGLLVVVLLLVAGGMCASAASAGGSGAILDDASDGVVDGSYSAAQVRAALVVVRSDPAYMQYSDIEGVLVEYLASLTGTTRPWFDPGARRRRCARPARKRRPATTQRQPRRSARQPRRRTADGGDDARRTTG